MTYFTSVVNERWDICYYADWAASFSGLTLCVVSSLPGGVLAEKLGRGVRPASQNPYPIYDQNLRFSLPYL